MGEDCLEVFVKISKWNFKWFDTLSSRNKFLTDEEKNICGTKGSGSSDTAVVMITAM